MLVRPPAAPPPPHTSAPSPIFTWARAQGGPRTGSKAFLCAICVSGVCLFPCWGFKWPINKPPMLRSLMKPVERDGSSEL